MKVKFVQSDDGVLDADCPVCHRNVSACITDEDTVCVHCGADFVKNEDGTWEMV